MSPLIESQMSRWIKCLEGVSEWAPSLFLPLRNPFIPTDFSIRGEGVNAESASVSRNPELIECTTTVEEEEEDVAVTVDAVSISLETVTSSSEIVGGTLTDEKEKQGEAKTVDKVDQGEGDEERDEEEEEEINVAGQLSPPKGKVANLIITDPALLYIAFLCITLSN